MQLWKIFLIIALQLITIAAAAQQTAGAIDTLLSTVYKQLQDSVATPDIANIAGHFKQLMQQHLGNAVTFNNRLPLLEKSITVTQTDDKKIKFYSWDEMTGGTWHNIQCVAQYRGSNGSMMHQFLSMGSEMKTGGFTDSEIYQVHTIRENGKDYYLTFAYGTHGGGNQHVIFRVFRLAGNQLQAVKAFPDNSAQLVIEYPRTQKLNAVFKLAGGTLSYNEFVVDAGGDPWKRPTGKQKIWRFKNGVFR